ncbi:hypothetical protein KCU91_g22, partial [Aureobasidium melanogenum]
LHLGHYPIHSVSVSIGRSSSTTPLQYSSTQEEDDDVPDLDRMQRKERECSAEHIGDKAKDEHNTKNIPPKAPESPSQVWKLSYQWPRPQLFAYHFITRESTRSPSAHSSLSPFPLITTYAQGRRYTVRNVDGGGSRAKSEVSALGGDSDSRISRVRPRVQRETAHRFVAPQLPISLSFSECNTWLLSRRSNHQVSVRLSRGLTWALSRKMRRKLVSHLRYCLRSEAGCGYTHMLRIIRNIHRRKIHPHLLRSHVQRDSIVPPNPLPALLPTINLLHTLSSPSQRSKHAMDCINTILNNLFALCHTLGGRVENLYLRIVRNDVEQATMNQGLIESLAGAHQKIRNLEAQQTVLEQRLALLERGAGPTTMCPSDIKIMPEVLPRESNKTTDLHREEH